MLSIPQALVGSRDVYKDIIYMRLRYYNVLLGVVLRSFVGWSLDENTE